MEEAFELWAIAAEFLARKQSFTARCEDERFKVAAKIRDELGLPKVAEASPYALEGSRYWPARFPATYKGFARKVLNAKSEATALSRLRPYLVSELKRLKSIETGTAISQIAEPSTSELSNAIAAFKGRSFDKQTWDKTGVSYLRFLAITRSAKAAKAANHRHGKVRGKKVH